MSISTVSMRPKFKLYGKNQKFQALPLRHRKQTACFFRQVRKPLPSELSTLEGLALNEPSWAIWGDLFLSNHLSLGGMETADIDISKYMCFCQNLEFPKFPPSKDHIWTVNPFLEKEILENGPSVRQSISGKKCLYMDRQSVWKLVKLEILGNEPFWEPMILEMLENKLCWEPVILETLEDPFW